MKSTSFRLFPVLLLTLVITGCGDFVFPDRSGLEQLRGAKDSSREISVEGQVTDEAGNPLPDIMIIVINRYLTDSQIIYGSNYIPLDTLFTNGSGCYAMERKTVAPALPDVQVNACDGNGRFAADSVSVRNVTAGTVIPTLVLKKK